ncbi:MAG: hypothetical protein QOJ65_828 [Fimbriimonadaceae bacterium]|jgi:hypothetical protein|nr:hypothetical protein [Fimbriimonadaceae bacterium]
MEGSCFFSDERSVEMFTRRSAVVAEDAESERSFLKLRVTSTLCLEHFLMALCNRQSAIGNRQSAIPIRR